ncbi:MAG TPA: ThuA domain-containing protein [Verrucomicrobiae bacterium]|nr:ThuA domain-containing protein [Verrucomicrobiae bacterium]
MKGLIAPASVSILASLLLIGCASNRNSTSADSKTKKALVVTTTTGFRHSSIKTAETVLASLGEQSRAFTVDYVHQPPNEPQEPRKPDVPKAPKPDSDPKKQKAEQEKYEAAKERYESDLAKYQADEPRLKAEYQIARPAWEAKLKEALMKLAPDSLKNYDIVIFANTTGDLPLPDPDGFIDWIRQGHAFVGTHSASDTFHHYRPYIEMLGGEFQTHGAQERVECIVKDPKHPATKHFGPTYNIGGTNEEIYIIKSYDPATVHELLYLDKHPNTKQPGHYAVSWCKQFGKGKVFYTSLGHNEFVWEREDYQKHVLGGIKWALGLERGDATPQTRQLSKQGYK